MTAPPVSVVLPVHNGAPHLGDAVRSILAQSLSDFELVICNDGSDDDTAAIAAACARADPRVRVASRPAKSGVAAAANWAVSEARAELVALAHADDLSHPDRLARQVALMQAEPDCVLTGAPALTIDWYGKEAHPPNFRRLVHPGAFAPFAHSSIMLRRPAFVAAGGYRSEADYWEDLDLYWRMARQGRILVSVRPLTTYRYSRISIRSRDAALGVERALEAMYRAAAAVERGTPSVPGVSATGAKLHPRIFVARSWSRVWAGERAAMLGQLLRRGRLGFDRATLESLGFVTWAGVAPKSLRFALRLATRWRNRTALRSLRGQDFVAWNPCPAPRRDSPIA